MPGLIAREALEPFNDHIAIMAVYFDRGADTVDLMGCNQGAASTAVQPPTWSAKVDRLIGTPSLA